LVALDLYLSAGEWGAEIVGHAYRNHAASRQRQIDAVTPLTVCEHDEVRDIRWAPLAVLQRHESSLARDDGVSSGRKLVELESPVAVSESGTCL
jgi:hypothetical protein